MNSSYFNPLVPSVHFLDVFPVFLSKRRCSSQRIFSMKPSKSPLSIFLSTGANLKIIEKKADLWGPKNGRPFWPEKNFFWLFYAETTWKCFSRPKNFFWKKFFWKILVSLAANIKATLPPAVITIHRKVPRDIFIYNVEKFNLLA